MSYPLLKIKNFGPIKDIEIELRPFTIFIGPNSAGKSTLCKVIASILNRNKHVNIIINAAINSGSSIQLSNKEIKISDSNLKINFLNEFRISDYFSEETKISLIEKNSKFHLEDNLIIYSFEETDDSSVLLLSSILEILKNTELLNNIQFNFKILKDDIIYIPSERGIFTKIKQDDYVLINLSEENNYYLLNYLQKYSIARRELKEFKSEDLKISYKYNDGSNEEFSYSSNDYFPTYLASSGVRNILSMALPIEHAARKNNASTIILEEPEISLYPDNQFEFIKYLIKTKNTAKNINHIIVSTHSTDVLGTFSISAYAGYLLKKYPNLNDDILKILSDLKFDDKCLINNEDLVAYYVKDGTCKKILIDEDNFLVIDDEELLKVSNFTGKIINELYELASKNNQ
jgi:ABC-type cobalamin/Fe3+-siderophores transport system ATPase subunit